MPHCNLLFFQCHSVPLTYSHNTQHINSSHALPPPTRSVRCIRKSWQAAQLQVPAIAPSLARLWQERDSLEPIVGLLTLGATIMESAALCEYIACSWLEEREGEKEGGREREQEREG